MNRRGFLGSILALGAAPAIARADSLMRIIPRETAVLVGDLELVARGSSGLIASPTFTGTSIIAGQREFQRRLNRLSREFLDNVVIANQPRLRDAAYYRGVE